MTRIEMAAAYDALNLLNIFRSFSNESKFNWIDRPEVLLALRDECEFVL